MSRKYQTEQLIEDNQRMKEALLKISKWHGEFPITGEMWANGTPMSYSTCYGSNGERDYMREVARKALEGE